MKKWVVIILKIVSVMVAIYSVMLAIFYFKITIPSEREIWRITEYSVSVPSVVNDLLIFHGYRKDRSVDCYCLYAVDKSTEEIIWSTEKLAQPYIGFAPGSSISFSVYTSLESVSETGDFIYVSLDYWDSDYTLEHILFAIRSDDMLAIDSNTGKQLWRRKVYPKYDEDYIWFTYQNNLVLVSTHSSECLKCCCTFISD